MLTCAQYTRATSALKKRKICKEPEYTNNHFFDSSRWSAVLSTTNQSYSKKVDFTTYKSDANHHAAAICRRYTIQNPNDYTKYNRTNLPPSPDPLSAPRIPDKTNQPSGICGSLRQLAHSLSNLDPSDPVRVQTEKIMLEKLYDMGILSGTTKPSEVERKVGVSRLARRRLGVVMTRLRMAENVTAAVRFVEQGHVRVGTEVVTDPAFLVTRNMEDFVTWVDSSKVKRNILKYREKLDDFDLL
ncbi:hypothetical protein HO173_002801 [Letharia columbiana]|uniref:U3 small nucleolar ribonucleoprotein protein IMP3 n=1 Tax=Letharia columbiana TaxID=112416 RepID=A0A8H6G1U9_9LECA|nr:uncharacterized protein HO173_002801 [Letharia columbiana]KAF6238929.1 hypothetical protein HO173_002801 [Letharia columbiana]